MYFLGLLFVYSLYPHLDSLSFIHRYVWHIKKHFFFKPNLKRVPVHRPEYVCTDREIYDILALILFFFYSISALNCVSLI